ncbi:MAG: DinB family protein [Bacteroidetes bacterium]|nr:DinB family protein [Bacteroidota bacterium]MBK9672625.1 DinB family protein [Bacteroidota bacterium]MBK9800350.1 DinB family protein [Bacteroidota bacterium]MBP6412307.1 DinB family protein [Bacteroidia bacterium]
MKKSIYPAEIMLVMNSRLFIAALEGVNDEQANQRISDHNNPLIWLATHTTWARFNICAMLGKPAKNPYEGKFENFKAYDPKDNYPTLAEVKVEWNKASELLKEALNTVTEEHLAAESPLKSPIGDFTFGGTVAFLAQHESYDIGQMAFLKKYHTKVAMKY